MYNVVFRASAADQGPVTVDRSAARQHGLDLEWFDEIPDEQDGAVADDIRLFLD